MRNLAALIVLIVGCVLFFRPQIQAGVRPSWRGGPPVWKNPVYGRKPSLWIGMAMMIIASNYVVWVSLAGR
jgi:hypothetical protein